MPDFRTPVGRLVQGSLKLEQQKDMDTGALEYNEDGTPRMGVFFALAFPKVLPNGQPNVEFDDFFNNQLGMTAAAAWPALFPNGYNPAAPNRGCTHPQFSWKYQDGDGVNASGQPVSNKPGFAGHHIIKFYTGYEFPCFNEGQFAPYQALQNPSDVIKRGDWVRVFGEVKSNGATGTKKPGISIYPKLLSFVQQGERIASGPDAAAAFSTPVGWTPPPVANSPIPQPGQPQVAVPQPQVAVPQPQVAVPQPQVAVPQPQPQVAVPQPQVAVPQPQVAVPQPQYRVNDALSAQGISLDALMSQGWTIDTALAAGHIIRLG